MIYVIVALAVAVTAGLVYTLSKAIERQAHLQAQADSSYLEEDHAAQDMVREVIRSGRPMVMNRGEAPRYVGPSVLPKPEVQCPVHSSDGQCGRHEKHSPPHAFGFSFPPRPHTVDPPDDDAA